jgi:PAS domain S-box-containing protein
MSSVYKDPVTDEWYYPDNAYILSETDEKGMILYANKLFCEIAGFTEAELLGKAHNIVRHPDMPRIAFKGLWDDIQTKGFWTGFVKNRRKDMDSYWVYATVIRKMQQDGSARYLSVRVKPSRSDVERYSKLYAELKEQE